MSFVALLAAMAAIGISLFALDGMPHIADEQAYFFQARLLAQGRLDLSPPPEPRLFEVQHILIDAEGWRAIYPPGWPGLLAVGVVLGVPWLVNPLFLGLSVVAVWWLGRTLYDPEIGVVAALLLAGSSFALSMGAGTMSHPGTLLLAVVTLGFLARADRSSSRALPWVLAGLAAGACLSIRPFSAVLLLGPPGLAFALRSPKRARALGLLAAGATPGVLFLIGYNLLQFGRLSGGYAVAYPDFSFTGMGGVHIPFLAILQHHIPWYWSRMNDHLWDLPFPDLLLLAPLLLPAQHRIRDWILLSGAAVLVLGHCGYFYSGEAYGGPRLVFAALGPLSVLGARSVQRIRGLLVRRANLGMARRPTVSLVLTLLLVAWPLSTVLPDRVTSLGDWYHGVSGLPRSTMESAGVGASALVLVAGRGSAYGSLFPYQELPPSRAKRVFVRDVPELRAAAEELYPRAEAWRVAIRLEPLPGPNPYPDRHRLETLRWRRLR